MTCYWGKNKEAIIVKWDTVKDVGFDSLRDWFKAINQLPRLTISWVDFRCWAFKLIKINQKIARAFDQDRKLFPEEAATQTGHRLLTRFRFRTIFFLIDTVSCVRSISGS